MARVKDGRQSHARAQRTDQDPMHLVVDNVAGPLEIDRVNHFIVAIVFVSVQVFGLSTMAYAKSSAFIPRNITMET